MRKLNFREILILYIDIEEAKKDSLITLITLHSQAQETISTQLLDLIISNSFPNRKIHLVKLVHRNRILHQPEQVIEFPKVFISTDQ
jgi:hypothetical protein